HAVVLVVPRAALLAGEDDDRPAPVAVADHGPGPTEGRVELDLVALHQTQTLLKRSARYGCRLSRQQVHVSPCLPSPHETFIPTWRRWSRRARLLARFSSAVPQVIATSSRPGAACRAAITVATKPVTWAKCEYRDSCGSSSGVKNDPDWSISP